MANIGQWFSNTFGFDPTPGFNLSYTTKGNNIQPRITGSGGNARTGNQGSWTPKKTLSSGAKTINNGPGDGGGSAGNYYAPGGGGGSGGGGGAPVKDTAAIRRNLQTTQSGYETSGHQSAKDVGNKYAGDVRSFLGNIEGQENTLNSGRSNNALNLRRSMSTIANTIRTGLRSAGVSLANSNATDSGASDAAARAYAKEGSAQTNDANNEFALADQDIQSKQGLLDRQKNEGLDGFNRYKDAEVSRIRGDVSNKLQVLDAQGQAEGVDGGVDMGIVQRVIDDAISQLAAIDQEKDQRLGGIRGISADEANAKAAQLDTAGQDASNPFKAGAEGINLTPSDSMQGAPITQLPFFVKPKTDQTQPVVA